MGAPIVFSKIDPKPKQCRKYQDKRTRQLHFSVCIDILNCIPNNIISFDTCKLSLKDIKRKIWRRHPISQTILFKKRSNQEI